MQEEITRSVTVVQQLPLQILPASFVRMHFVDMPSANVEVFFTFISTCFSCSMTVFAGQPEKKSQENVAVPEGYPHGNVTQRKPW